MRITSTHCRCWPLVLDCAKHTPGADTKSSIILASCTALEVSPEGLDGVAEL